MPVGVALRGEFLGRAIGISDFRGADQGVVATSDGVLLFF